MYDINFFDQSETVGPDIWSFQIEKKEELQ